MKDRARDCPLFQFMSLDYVKLFAMEIMELDYLYLFDAQVSLILRELNFSQHLA